MGQACVKDTRHQGFAKAVGLHTTDPDRQAGAQAPWHDSSQDNRIDDIFMSESVCTEALPSAENLNILGDADHTPDLTQIRLTCIKFLKAGLGPHPLP